LHFLSGHMPPPAKSIPRLEASQGRQFQNHASPTLVPAGPRVP
jgi:hypothetical protein